MIPVQEKMYLFLFLKLKKNIIYLRQSYHYVITDRDNSLTWKNKGFVERLQKIAIEISNIHFIETHYIIIHKEVLCKRVINMTNVIKPVKQNMVNFIKSCGLNQRQFSIFLNGLESKYSGLSYLTEERRLSYFTV